MTKTKSKKKHSAIPKVRVPALANKVKPKGKPAKRKVTKRSTDRPPVGMTPPEMRDTRPKPRSKERTSEPTVIASGQQRQDQTGTPAVTAATVVEPSTAPVAPAATVAPVHDPLVQGSSCIWLGPLSSAKENSQSQPRCPHCGGGLMTIPGGEESMMEGFRKFEQGSYDAINPAPRPHPGYMAFMAWIRQQAQTRCWSTIEQAANVYALETGQRVDPTG